jgi:hypothetical protein
MSSTACQLLGMLPTRGHSSKMRVRHILVNCTPINTQRPIAFQVCGLQAEEKAEYCPRKLQVRAGRV